MDVDGLLSNAVRSRLDRNELALSMTVRLVRGVEIAALAKTAGVDSIYIDLEHCAFSLDTTSQICMACLAVGVAPFVRVPGIDPALIARILDGGALGIIVPHVESAAEAAAVVQAAKYPGLENARSPRRCRICGSVPFRPRSPWRRSTPRRQLSQ